MSSPIPLPRRDEEIKKRLDKAKRLRTGLDRVLDEIEEIVMTTSSSAEPPKQQ